MSLTINGAAGLFPQAEMDPTRLQPGGAALAHSLTSGGAVGRFQEAMHAASSVQPVQFAQVQPAGTITDAVPLTQVNPTAQATAPISATSAADNAVRGLGLAEQAEGPGQSILDGLGRLRNVFDTQTNTVAAASEGTMMDAATLMNLQTEVVRYTVLVDVSSKLAGKSTQALDALMKGQ